MENPSLPENGKKKRWTVEEKAQIVRRYLKDHVGWPIWPRKQEVPPG